MGEPARMETRPEATYEDLLALPDHVVGELIDGVLYVSARPAGRHALAASRLGFLLGPTFDFGGDADDAGRSGGWWILVEPELHFGLDHGRERAHPRRAIVSDLAGWRVERLPAIGEEAAFAIAPDWVCEVLSPSTAGHDRVRKLAIYAHEGVRHAWLLDPGSRSLEVFRLEEGRWVLAAAFLGNEVVRAEPFEALSFPLARLWPREPTDESAAEADADAPDDAESEAT